jgi:hypothetical protein
VTSGLKEGAAGAVGAVGENRATGNEGETDHRRHKHNPLEKKKWRGSNLACGPVAR